MLMVATCCGYAVCIMCVRKYSLSESTCMVCRKALTPESWMNPSTAMKVH
jgi:hypothetical protein